jgi:hypothetical protein
MGISIIDVAIEQARQEKTGDSKYADVGSWVFVLKAPANAGPVGPKEEIQFPLPINPTSFRYTLPFSVELSPLQEAGVVKEENGIVIGDMMIEGTTGFKLRQLRDTSASSGDGEFTGELTQSIFSSVSAGDAVSGQYAFWRLANRCFDGYSALKKDPEVAAKTSMEIHISKDDLHLEVVPREFTLERRASKDRVTYSYSIRLSVVGAAIPRFLPSPDENLLTKIKNGISRIRTSVQRIAATVDDVTAALDEISRTITSAAGIIDDFKQVIDAHNDLLDGTKRFLSTPRAFMVNLADQVESIAALAVNVESWPADVAQGFRSLGDELDRLIVAGTRFHKPTWEDKVRAYENKSASGDPNIARKKFASGGGVEDGTVSESDVLPGAGTTGLKVVDVFGPSGERPGDARRSLVVEPAARLNTQEYAGFREVVVGHGDTLQSIAARRLLRPDKWLDLAILNDLRSPFITVNKLPHTLQPGSKIVVPVDTPSVNPDTITGSGVPIGQSQAEEHLGQDFEMVQTTRDDGRPSGLFGWAIDTAGGSIDVRKVSGIANYSQALEMRFRTERGFNILYPSIGLPRLVGHQNFRERLADANYTARQQLLADKRTDRVVGFRFRVEQDRVFIDADVQPVGFNSSRVISRAIT